MGKVEKVIVLSVLFMIAAILVFSLTVDDPLNKSGVVEAGKPDRKPITAPVAGSEVAQAPAGSPTNPTLSAVVTPPAPTSTTAPVAPETTPVTPDATPVAPPQGAVVPPTQPVLPPGALLKKLDGLQDSILPDLKLYTWKEGDDLRRVAQNYYGDWQKFTVLRRSNEGHTDIKPGEKIFVPVFDTAATATVTPSEPAPKTDGAKPKTKDSKKSTKAAAVATGNKVHVVKEGESLWKIAKEELGDGNRWKEIFELNKDVLAKPESVHKGMRLHLP